MKKFLILRFSSIGDIVLTTPVIRSLRKAYPESEIHYFTKPAFKSILEHNPYVNQIHLLEDKLAHQLKSLKQENYDFILDLHKNLRTLRVKWGLKRPGSTFAKQNWTKYRMVRFKQKLILPHIVERYGQVLKPLGARLDGEGLDFFLPPGLEEDAQNELSNQGFFRHTCLAVVLGATYRTKRWIPEHFIDLLNSYGRPVMLIGGLDSIEEAEQISRNLKIPHWNTVGKYKLLMSAAIMKQCEAVLTHDTGFMHIAAAFKMPVFSIWGNTVPEFGMTPYKTYHTLLEVKDLDCRPCSKIGFDECPKGHFRCMRDLHPLTVLEELRQKVSD